MNIRKKPGIFSSNPSVTELPREGIVVKDPIANDDSGVFGFGTADYDPVESRR